jgi:aspartate/methionine/tyrosine aminotransferase
MERQMRRFPKNDIMSLIGEAPRYDLGESVGPDIHLGDLLGASGEMNLGDMALGYGTAEGDPRLRKAIADAHGVGADDVVVTVGGMHALFLTAFILCDQGDEAVTTSPMFPLARNALEVVGAEVRTLPLSFDRGYQIDVAELRRRLSERTRLVSLASPHNPSGVAIPQQTIREVIALMGERCPEAYLLLDETYREAAYGDDLVTPSAVGLSPRVISCASLSKCHGAPGLRLGWAITRDAALREQLVVGKFNTVVSCSPVDEVLALRVLQLSDRIIGERRQRLAEGLAMTADWVQEHEGFVDWVRPDAGAICCLRLKPPVFADRAVSRFYEALASEGVRVANGSWFGDEARVFRLGFGLLSMPNLKTALQGLSAAVKRTAREAA